MQLQAALEIQVAQGRSDDGMFDLLGRLARFDLAVNDANPVLEKRRQMTAGEPAVFIDRRRQHRAAVDAIPGGIIGAAAEKRDAKRSPADDHPCHLGANPAQGPSRAAADNLARPYHGENAESMSRLLDGKGRARVECRRAMRRLLSATSLVPDCV
jgi:hypothetical protein